MSVHACACMFMYVHVCTCVHACPDESWRAQNHAAAGAVGPAGPQGLLLWCNGDFRPFQELFR